MANMTARDTHASYGVLITVLGLLAVVIFSDGGYDFWDLLIGIIGAAFALSFLVSIAEANIFEILLAGLIVGMGVAIIVAMAFAYLEWSLFSGNPPKLADRLFGSEFLVALIVASTLGAVYWFRKRKGPSHRS